jgi:type VI protein secretion system component VasF
MAALLRRINLQQFSYLLPRWASSSSPMAAQSTRMPAFIPLVGLYMAGVTLSVLYTSRLQYEHAGLNGLHKINDSQSVKSKGSFPW